MQQLKHRLARRGRNVNLIIIGKWFLGQITFIFTSSRESSWGIVMEKPFQNQVFLFFSFVFLKSNRGARGLICKTREHAQVHLESKPSITIREGKQASTLWNRLLLSLDNWISMWINIVNTPFTSLCNNRSIFVIQLDTVSVGLWGNEYIADQE